MVTKKTAAKKSSAKKSPAKKVSAPAVKARRAVRRALCVGINDYPYDGSDLNGCVNDANAWAKTLIEHYDFKAEDVTILLDSAATRKNTLAALQNLLAGARAGDTLVYTNSSHGSYVVDTDGDEEKYDEIICPYDIGENEIKDDDLRQLFQNLTGGVSLSVILDNCFSGTATRAAIADIIPGLRPPDERRVRFLSPALRGMKVLANPWRAKPSTLTRYPESGMNEILLTGCTDREYSYDALLDGTYHGAMTYYALQALRQSDYRLTYAQLHQRVVNSITDYPQHPQLEGKTENKKRLVFS